jgi:two-component system chemotaxis response regulator CheB
MSNPKSFDLLLVAASADGLKAISSLLSALPRAFPTPVAVVLHRSPHTPGLLAPILGRVCALRVKEAEEGESFRPGVVYIAPAAWHLVVRPDRTFHLMDGKRIKFLASAANPLFESAAQSLERVIAVILTGSGTDGTDGVQAVHAKGGIVIVQDPATTAFSRMPESAIESGAVDRVLSLEDIPAELTRLVTVASDQDASRSAV